MLLAMTQPRPTIEDVARACGVSKGTVSKALSPAGSRVRIAAATRERIRSTAERLGYDPDWQMRIRARSRSGSIGLTYGGHAPYTGGVYENLIVVLAEHALRLGQRLVLVPCSGGPATWRRIFCDHRMDACVLTGPSPEMEAFFADERIPAIVFNEEGGDSVARVLVDEVVGTRTLVAHLLGLGHRRIAFCHYRLDRNFEASMEHYSFDQRLTTFRSEVVAAGGIAIDRIGESVEETVRRLATDPAERETALVCACHEDAFALLRGCALAGLAIPQAASVVCFNRVSAMRWIVPDLTTIEVPVEQMAERAISRLVQQVEGRVGPEAQRIRCAPKLLVAEVERQLECARGTVRIGHAVGVDLLPFAANPVVACADRLIAGSVALEPHRRCRIGATCCLRRPQPATDQDHAAALHRPERGRRDDLYLVGWNHRAVARDLQRLRERHPIHRDLRPFRRPRFGIEAEIIRTLGRDQGHRGRRVRQQGFDLLPREIGLGGTQDDQIHDDGERAADGKHAAILRQAGWFP
jgi:LacI family repressor for deo operon, udp, cdd, tsx, nupC, and nupG